MDRIRRLEKVVDDLNTELESQAASSGASKRGSPSTHDASLGGNSPDRLEASSSDPDASIRESVILSDIIPPGPQSQCLKSQPIVDPSEERSSVYVGDQFWASLRREASSYTSPWRSLPSKLLTLTILQIRVIREAFDELSDLDGCVDSTYEPSLLPPDGNAFASHPCFVFANGSGKDENSNRENLDAFLPLPAEMFFIWQTFVEIVSPFVHILHIPTVEKMIHVCKGRINTLEPSMEALAFAISMTTVNSMTEEEVGTNQPQIQQNLGRKTVTNYGR